MHGAVCHHRPLSTWTHITRSWRFNSSFNHCNLALHPSEPPWQTVMKYETSVPVAAKIKPWLRLIDQCGCGLNVGEYVVFTQRLSNRRGPGAKQGTYSHWHPEPGATASTCTDLGSCQRAGTPQPEFWQHKMTQLPRKEFSLNEVWFHGVCFIFVEKVSVRVYFLYSMLVFMQKTIYLCSLCSVTQYAYMMVEIRYLNLYWSGLLVQMT